MENVADSFLFGGISAHDDIAVTRKCGQAVFFADLLLHLDKLFFGIQFAGDGRQKNLAASLIEFLVGRIKFLITHVFTKKNEAEMKMKQKRSVNHLNFEFIIHIIDI